MCTFFVALAICISVIDAQGFSGRYVPLQEWFGSTWQHYIPYLWNQNLMNIIVDHTTTAECNTDSECTLLMRKIRNDHVYTNDFEQSEVAHHFYIGGNGNIYGGRHLDREGAFAKQYNNVSIGVAFIGNFQDKEPKMNMMNAFRSLVSNISAQINRCNLTVLPHRDIDYTDSPGLSLYHALKSWGMPSCQLTYNASLCKYNDVNSWYPTINKTSSITLPQVAPATFRHLKIYMSSDIGLSPFNQYNYSYFYMNGQYYYRDSMNLQAISLQRWVTQQNFTTLPFNFVLLNDIIYEGLGWFHSLWNDATLRVLYHDAPDFLYTNATSLRCLLSNGLANGQYLPLITSNKTFP